MGQGATPRDYNPLMDSYAAADNERHLAGIRREIAAAAARMPTHEDAIRQRLNAAPQSR